MKKYKCIVNKIIFTEGTTAFGTTTGVKQENQWRYSRYKGGYGTYLTDFYNTPSELKVKIFVCELEKYVYLDIKDSVLEINNRKRITKKLIDTLEVKNRGSRIWFQFNENLSIDNSVKNIEKLDLMI